MGQQLMHEQDVARALAEVAPWTRDGQTLVRQFRASSFRTAQRIINRVADLAEGANHHPDLRWSYDRLTFSLTTHDVGGLTAQDFALARLIEDVLADG